MSPLLTANATLMFIHDLGSRIVLTEKLVELMYETVGLLSGRTSIDYAMLEVHTWEIASINNFNLHEYS